jgi:hypothetical protein
VSHFHDSFWGGPEDVAPVLRAADLARATELRVIGVASLVASQVLDDVADRFAKMACEFSKAAGIKRFARETFTTFLIHLR